MAEVKASDSEFIRVWAELGSAQKVADHFGMGVRAVYTRRRRIEGRTGRKLISEIEVGSKPRLLIPENQMRAELTMLNGTILVGSDCHYMPGPAPTAHRAFVQAVKRFKPTVICLNGDIADFGTIGRHPQMNSRPKPTLKQELEVVQERVSEIEAVCGNALLHRTVGNHDMRLDVRIANQAPEFAGLIGLEDFLPRWKVSISLLVNNNTIILHKYHNGMHAAHNNVIKAGLSIVTGHTHRLMAKPWTDYNGTRMGIETGTLADPENDCFEYCLDTPKNWQPGFAMLTFKEGQLLHPEFAQVIGENCFFRSEALL